MNAESEKFRAYALEAQGAIQPVIGALKLGSPLPDQIERLEVAHDYIKRILDGENWKEEWAKLNGESRPSA